MIFQKLLIDIIFYLIPAMIVVYRHTDKVSDSRYRMFGIVILMIIAFMYFRKKHKIMKIKETKEIEDQNRKSKTIIYFYIRFAVLFIGAYAAIHYIQFNFEQLRMTMNLIAVTLIIGALLRIDLANRHGV